MQDLVGKILCVGWGQHREYKGVLKTLTDSGFATIQYDDGDVGHFNLLDLGEQAVSNANEGTNDKLKVPGWYVAEQ